jgi:hypothetical protein
VELYRPHPNEDGIVPDSPTKHAQKFPKTYLVSPKTERPGYIEGKRSSRSDFRRMMAEEKLDQDLGAQISSQRTVKINQQRRWGQRWAPEDLPSNLLYGGQGKLESSIDDSSDEDSEEEDYHVYVNTQDTRRRRDAISPSQLLDYPMPPRAAPPKRDRRNAKILTRRENLTVAKQALHHSTKEKADMLQIFMRAIQTRRRLGRSFTPNELREILIKSFGENPTKVGISAKMYSDELADAYASRNTEDLAQTHSNEVDGLEITNPENISKLDQLHRQLYQNDCPKDLSETLSSQRPRVRRGGIIYDRDSLRDCLRDVLDEYLCENHFNGAPHGSSDLDQE